VGDSGKPEPCSADDNASEGVERSPEAHIANLYSIECQPEMLLLGKPKGITIASIVHSADRVTPELRWTSTCYLIINI
jgi:hypothetical protein